jgi:hypothetical protein
LEVRRAVFLLTFPSLINCTGRFGLLKKTDTGFDVAVPHYSATDRQAFTWIERDVPTVVLALLKNYSDSSKNISGKAYPIVNETIPYAELAVRTGKGTFSRS